MNFQTMEYFRAIARAEELHEGGRAAARDAADPLGPHRRRGARAGSEARRALHAASPHPRGRDVPVLREALRARPLGPAPRARRPKYPTARHASRGHLLHARPDAAPRRHRAILRAVPKRDGRPSRGHERGPRSPVSRLACSTLSSASSPEASPSSRRTPSLTSTWCCSPRASCSRGAGSTSRPRRPALTRRRLPSRGVPLRPEPAGGHIRQTGPQGHRARRLQASRQGLLAQHGHAAVAGAQERRRLHLPARPAQ